MIGASCWWTTLTLEIWIRLKITLTLTFVLLKDVLPDLAHNRISRRCVVFTLLDLAMVSLKLPTKANIDNKLTDLHIWMPHSSEMKTNLGECWLHPVEWPASARFRDLAREVVDDLWGRLGAVWGWFGWLFRKIFEFHYAKKKIVVRIF